MSGFDISNRFLVAVVWQTLIANFQSLTGAKTKKVATVPTFLLGRVGNLAAVAI